MSFPLSVIDAGFGAIAPGIEALRDRGSSAVRGHFATNTSRQEAFPSEHSVTIEV
jgi:hypothetical protein